MTPDLPSLPELSDAELIDMAKQVLGWRQDEDWLVFDKSDNASPAIHIDDVVKIMRCAIGARSTAAQPVEPTARFDDARVQIVYELLCDGREVPPPIQDWAGLVARRTVDALFAVSRDSRSPAEAALWGWTRQWRECAETICTIVGSEVVVGSPSDLIAGVRSALAASGDSTPPSEPVQGDSIGAPRPEPEAAGQAWLSIETAPKDGSLFLCWVSAVSYGETDEGQQYQTDVSQPDFCQWQSFDEAPDGGWFEPCCGHISDSQAVTHWMPLPPHPAASQQADLEAE